MSGEVKDLIQRFLGHRLSELAADREMVGDMYELAYRKVATMRVVDARVWVVVWADYAYSAPAAAKARGIEGDPTLDGLLSTLARDGVMLGVSDRTADLLLEVLDRTPEPLRSSLVQVLADRGRLTRDPGVTVTRLAGEQGG